MQSPRTEKIIWFLFVQKTLIRNNWINDRRVRARRHSSNRRWFISDDWRRILSFFFFTCLDLIELFFSLFTNFRFQHGKIVNRGAQFRLIVFLTTTEKPSEILINLLTSRSIDWLKMPNENIVSNSSAHRAEHRQPKSVDRNHRTHTHTDGWILMTGCSYYVQNVWQSCIYSSNRIEYLKVRCECDNKLRKSKYSSGRRESTNSDAIHIRGAIRG